MKRHNTPTITYTPIKSKSNRYCTLYIVRHGETDWNIKGLLQGHTDIPLNRAGEIQAKKVARKLGDLDVAMSFSSDVVRAKRTAEIIALEKKIAVRSTKALRERSFGKYEGKPWREIEYQDLLVKFFKLSSRERFKKTPYRGFESDEKLMVRFIPLLREVSIANLGKNVLVVTHGGILRAFLNHLDFNQGKELPPGSIDNTAYIIIQSDGVDFFIRETSGLHNI